MDGFCIDNVAWGILVATSLSFVDDHCAQGLSVKRAMDIRSSNMFCKSEKRLMVIKE